MAAEAQTSTPTNPVCTVRRLTPSYAAVVFFYATLFWRVGSGPLWDQVIGHESEACTKYWWTNLFYVNNYINTDKLVSD